MASELGGGDDSNGSLFEGMVLFTPSDDPPPPTPPFPPEAAPPPTPSQSQPLDEDLFSDLTIQTPQPIVPEPPPLASDPHPPHLSRQISRKKKRAVRIGYARDAAAPFAAPDEPLPSCSSSSGAATVIATSPIELPPPSLLPSSSGEANVIATTTSSLAELPTPFRLETDSNSHHAVPDFPDQLGGEPDDKKSDSVLEEDEDQDKDPGSIEEDMAPPADGAWTKGDACESIEAKLELVRARISKNLDFLGKKVASVSAERKELLRRQRKAAESVNLASERYRELESELEEACEAEDFERAERVSESLATVEKEKDELLVRLRQVEMECDSVQNPRHPNSKPT